jgi:Cof subfamily protein (haloacid dehalogenase superfamily)
MAKKIKLVLADVDGTLLTAEKVLTERAQNAVKLLKDAGIHFAITSGRPPRGMAMLIDPLKLETPIAGFNGGMFVDRHLEIVGQKILPLEIAREAVDLLRSHGLDTWVYRGNDWLISRTDAPHVARESWTVKFEPTVVADVSRTLDQAVKIVGVSDDHEKVKRCESAAQSKFEHRATAARSQPYYLDITSREANKGAVVDFLSGHIGVPVGEIATIGDQANDILMFEHSGFSIAMDNASDEVKMRASATTDSYRDDGFAKAMERFVLASR